MKPLLEKAAQPRQISDVMVSTLEAPALCQSKVHQPCWPVRSLGPNPANVLLEISFTQQIILKHLFYEGARLEPELRVTDYSQR